MSRFVKSPQLTPEQSTRLRAAGLKEFPQLKKTFRCPRCGFGFFNLYEDKARCQKCAFWTKIEGPDRKTFSEFKRKFNSILMKVDPKDKAVVCLSCHRNLFRIWASRLECAYEHLGIEFTPTLMFYWPMAVVLPYVTKGKALKTQSNGPKHLSRSSIYRDIKKQKD